MARHRTSQADSEAANLRCSTDSGVSVAVRVKPAHSKENVVIWPRNFEVDGECRRLCCHRGFVVDEYEFSHVFGPEDNNACLFETLHGAAIVNSVFSGVNETLFAYGQTGSGKTHTIFGTMNDPGLLHFFVHAVFAQRSLCEGSTVHVCCYEVLGDVMTDLVNPATLLRYGQLSPQDIVWDELFLKTQKFRYQIVQVASESTCLTLLQDARDNRSVGVSSCNGNSSRSHAVVHLFIQTPQHQQTGCGEIGASSSAIAALTLVDLAGAEKEHENPSEQGRKSTRLLNTSLSSLNRLLRKLQTNSLDESERRQSVLNKCLWEYLRPGCGIALVFCVSPLLKHRTNSLSTLAMASSSKSIRSCRKSQYVQLQQQTTQIALDAGSPNRMAGSPRAGSPHADKGANRMPASPCAATPRGCRARSDTGVRSARTPDRTSTPRASTPRRAACSKDDPFSDPSRSGTARKLSSSSPFCLSASGDRKSFEEQAKRNSLQSIESASMQFLEAKNAELKRKLAKVRTRSRERLVGVEQDRDQLSTENTMLRQECEALRSLLLRQQQEQIAFWAGPFMEMMVPKGSIVSGTPNMHSHVANDTTTQADASDTAADNIKHNLAQEANIPEKMQDSNRAESLLIRSVPTPFSGQRNSRSNLDAPPKERQDRIVATGPRKSRLSLERRVVKVDLCDPRGCSDTSRESRCDSSESDCDWPDTQRLSDNYTDGARSTCSDRIQRR